MTKYHLILLLFVCFSCNVKRDSVIINDTTSVIQEVIKEAYYRKDLDSPLRNLAIIKNHYIRNEYSFSSNAANRIDIINSSDHWEDYAEIFSIDSLNFYKDTCISMSKHIYYSNRSSSYDTSFVKNVLIKQHQNWKVIIDEMH